MTAAVKDELARLLVTKTCCRRAEACALLRFAHGLRIVGGASWSGPSWTPVLSPAAWVPISVSFMDSKFT
jgi:hypothetical protein